jgi:hypothetical protein
MGGRINPRPRRDGALGGSREPEGLEREIVMSIRLRTFVVVSSVSLVALATVACGKPKSDGKAGSTNVTSAAAPKGGRCLLEKAGTCSEYKDNALGLAESACKDLMKGVYSKESCPTADLMGVCERKGDKKFFYFGGSTPWVSDAQESCEKDGLEPGKFTAQPGAEQIAKDKALPAPTRIQGSCINSAGTCEDLFGEAFEIQKSMCEQLDGKFSASPCTTDKLVASCVKNGKVERLYEKDLKSQKLSDLQSSCEKYAIPFGHFYPNPNAAAAAAPKPVLAGKAKGASTGGGGSVKAKQK